MQDSLVGSICHLDFLHIDKNIQEGPLRCGKEFRILSISNQAEGEATRFFISCEIFRVLFIKFR